MDSQQDKSMIQSRDEDEISIVDLIAVLLRHKFMILGVTIVVALATLIYSIGSLVLPPEKSYLPNLYKPTASLLLSSVSDGLASKLASSGLGSLASLAGISGGSSSSGQLAVAIAKSNTTIDELNAEFDFTSRYKITGSIKSNTRDSILSKFSTTLDSATGILLLSYEDIDPEFAMRVVNKAVEILDRRFMTLGGNKALEQKRLLEK